jgi:hypothetical protein
LVPRFKWEACNFPRSKWEACNFAITKARCHSGVNFRLSENLTSQNLSASIHPNNTTATMSPNLKHVTLLSDPLCNLEVSRPKEALNQQSLTQQSKTVNSDNYWAWTSEPDRTADLFSADHLEANLINYSQSKPSTTATFSS